MSEERNLRDEDPFLGLLVAGRYRVVAPLARGGMGRLYRAVQENLGREIALKILDIQELRDSTGGDAAGKGFADRFFLEAASVAKLSHPNTVTVHDYGTMDDGACFIAMELLHGRTLSELINADAPLAPRRAVRIALQVCASLAEAHAHGLVHRDLKPGNIMLIEHGADREFVKVLDFGLVKRENEESDLTASGALVGTPKYMAPEQVTGDNVGQWSDVYALGAVLYHMLTGHPPFVGDSKFALLAAHMNVKPTPMAEDARAGGSARARGRGHALPGQGAEGSLPVHGGAGRGAGGLRRRVRAACVEHAVERFPAHPGRQWRVSALHRLRRAPHRPARRGRGHGAPRHASSQAVVPSRDRRRGRPRPRARSRRLDLPPRSLFERVLVQRRRSSRPGWSVHASAHGGRSVQRPDGRRPFGGAARHRAGGSFRSHARE